MIQILILRSPGVLLVGAGTTTDGIKYWKIKNRYTSILTGTLVERQHTYILTFIFVFASWGPAWGEEGYIRLQRAYVGPGAAPPKGPPPPQYMGTCGMNQMPFIPLYTNTTK